MSRRRSGVRGEQPLSNSNLTNTFFLAIAEAHRHHDITVVCVSGGTNDAGADLIVEANLNPFVGRQNAEHVHEVNAS